MGFSLFRQSLSGSRELCHTTTGGNSEFRSSILRRTMTQWTRTVRLLRRATRLAKTEEKDWGTGWNRRHLPPASRPGAHPASAFGWLQEVSCCQPLLQALAGAAPALMRSRRQEGFCPAGFLLTLLRLRHSPSWDRRQSWPLQEGSGCGHLLQPVARTAAPAACSAPALPSTEARRRHKLGNSCLPTWRSTLVPTQPACRLAAGRFPLPVAAARLWPAPPLGL